MRKVTKLLLVIAICGFIYSGFEIIRYLYDGYNNKQLQLELQQMYKKSIANQQNDKLSSVGDSSINAKEEAQENLEHFLPLLEINEDVKGWISIAGTTIDYPIVQGEDNDYYLEHNIYREASKRGSIFMDYRNSLQPNENLVIYGHEMKDGSMFGELTGYKQQSFYEDHRYISIYTFDDSSTWEVFSVYIYEPTDHFFKINFANEQEKIDFLTFIEQKSLYPTYSEVTAEDELLTLVTCTYEVHDGRLVVHAKKVK